MQNRYAILFVLLSAVALARKPKPIVISEGPDTDYCPTCSCMSCRMPEYRPKDIVDSADSTSNTNDKQADEEQ